MTEEEEQNVRSEFGKEGFEFVRIEAVPCPST